MSPKQFHGITRVVVVLAVAVLYSPRCLGDNSATTAPLVVGYTGEQAPGLPAGTTYQRLTYFPTINNAGIVVYGSTPPSSSATTSIWVENLGSESLLYTAGGQAPGAPPGDKFNYFVAASGDQNNSFIVNDSGHLAFAGVFNAPGTENGFSTGIWSNQSGAVTAIALQGSQPPGYVGTWKFNPTPTPTGQPTQLWFNNEGDVAFLGKVTNATSDYSIGIWSTLGGSLHVVAADGMPAPGTSSGVTFSNNGSPAMPAFNGKGEVAFFGDLVGTGIARGANDTGLWAERNGMLALVARAGGQVPGLPTGTTFTKFPYGFSANAPGFNAAGQLAFDAQFGPGTNKSGVWAGQPAALELVAVTGEQAPGTPAGTVFGGTPIITFRMPIINRDGDVAFEGQLTGTGITANNKAGIWYTVDGNLTLLARGGDQAPGAPAGTNFLSFGSFVLNSQGRIAFLANTTAGNGIWAQNTLGQLTLIALVGQPLQLKPGLFLNPDSLSFAGNSGNEDGQQSGFNDLGQVVFFAGDSNITGIFISNAAAVPEPASFFLLGTGAIVLAATSLVNRRKARRRRLLLSADRRRRFA